MDLEIRNPVRIGCDIRVPSETGREIQAKVLKKYRRWALVLTEYDYKTTVWLDKRGNIVT